MVMLTMSFPLIIAIIMVVVLLAVLLFRFAKPSESDNSNEEDITVENAKSGNAGKADAEVMAAISLAMHLYFDDGVETTDSKVTIKRVSRAYSPWSSKIYGLNNAYYNKK